MRFYKIKPPESLAPFVRFYWVLESEVCPNSEYVYRHMANGSAELIFHYQGHFDEIPFEANGKDTCKSFTSGIHAQTTRARRFKIDCNFGIFGVYLYPYALPMLFGIPASELSNMMFEIETLLGQAGRILEEKILTAESNQERTAIMSNFLTDRLLRNNRDDQRFYSCIQEVVQFQGNVNINVLAQQCGVSVRQFERKFKEYSGFGPKLYCRIMRFQSVFDEFKNGKLQLTEIAHTCGYFDQSHFIHEFREFSGYNPKQFLSGKVDTTIID